MVTPTTRVEVLVPGPVPEVDSVLLILLGVGVDNVHENRDTKTVRLVDHRLQLIGRPEATTRREEVRHVVPKGPVVGVLLNRHDLDRVVTQRSHAR